MIERTAIAEGDAGRGRRQEEVCALALKAGFAAAGVVALPYAEEERDGKRFTEWVAAGRAGTMGYLERRNEGGELVRTRVAVPFPWARSAVVCLANYNTDEARSTDAADAGAGWIARYAWSSRKDERGEVRPSDYHKVLLKRMKALEAGLRERMGEFEARAYVDTGPVMERALATAAGLGWTGKNTCLIHPKLGSFGFLGVLLTSLEIEQEESLAGGGEAGGLLFQVSKANPHPSDADLSPGTPRIHPSDVDLSPGTPRIHPSDVDLSPGTPRPGAPVVGGRSREEEPGFAVSHPSAMRLQKDGAPLIPDRCGTCTRCLEACPTGALVAPYQMDATKCISYLTIEHKGGIGEELMAGMGRQVFGCDICQDVCPWNRKAPIGRDLELEARKELVNPALEWLAQMDEATWERMFNGSPVRRAGFAGFRRNVAIAMGNSGVGRFAGRLEEWADAGDEGLRTAARWGLGRLRGAD